MMPRLALLLAATSLVAVAMPSLAPGCSRGTQAPGSPRAGSPASYPRPTIISRPCRLRRARCSPLPSHNEGRQAAPAGSRSRCWPSSTRTSRKSHDATQAAPIAETIEGLWLQSGSDTIGVLMGRSAKAINEQKNDLALQLLDAVVELAPDYAEGWNRRAYVYFLQNNYEGAIGDLRRALALDPNHFKALEGLARILRDSGQKKNALQAYKQILKINPFQEGAKEAVDELSVEVEGQGI